jgi:mannose-6-phosphate isomerase-like protein (cupin superfamily)
MGRVVTFAQLKPQTSDGVSMAAITGGDVREMGAAFVCIEPGKRWSDSVPDGSDCYLFVLGGSGTIAVNGARHRLSPQTFATVEERQIFAIDNDGSGPIDMVRVLAPPTQNGSRRLAGFDQKLRVAERGKTPIVDIPDEKKRRIYFVGHGAAHSARGHAMIVMYAKDTVTGLHHHPNAESMFVPLDGALQFTVNGEQVKVAPAQAAYFAMNDTHGLRVADGHSGASFLEFHIPAAFTTVRE